MNRRDLLKLLPAAAVATGFQNGKPAFAAFDIPADRKIWLWAAEGQKIHSQKIHRRGAEAAVPPLRNAISERGREDGFTFKEQVP